LQNTELNIICGIQDISDLVSGEPADWTPSRSSLLYHKNRPMDLDLAKPWNCSHNHIKWSLLEDEISLSKPPFSQPTNPSFLNLGSCPQKALRNFTLSGSKGIKFLSPSLPSLWCWANTLPLSYITNHILIFGLRNTLPNSPDLSQLRAPAGFLCNWKPVLYLGLTVAKGYYYIIRCAFRMGRGSEAEITSSSWFLPTSRHIGKRQGHL
jgi:hypothetical protein